MPDYLERGDQTALLLWTEALGPFQGKMSPLITHNALLSSITRPGVLYTFFFFQNLIIKLTSMGV